jgi:IclR family transcriptional regulator, acetate operon repressor
MNPTAAKAYPGTQAVLRAVGLLKAFTPERPAQGLAELARTVGLNKTTAYRLLTALASEGLVGRDGEAWRLGPELLALGARACGAAELRAAARPELEALAVATRETATVEVLVGRDVLILDEVMGPHMLGSMPSVGTRWPAHATSTGKALLAHLSADAREAWLAGPLAPATPRTIVRPGAFVRELVRVRARGYAVSTEELEKGYVAVGAPVRAAGGEVVAALSLGGPALRLTSSRVAALGGTLAASAARMSERLGFRTNRAAGTAPDDDLDRRGGRIHFARSGAEGPGGGARRSAPPHTTRKAGR